jgi:hypothetical protein
MIETKAYAAQSPNKDLAPWTFEQREVGPPFSLIFYIAVFATQICIRSITTGFRAYSPWYQDMKL